MANKIKVDPETRIVFNDANGTRSASDINLAFSPSGLAISGGWVSSLYDAGASPRTYIYEWRGKTKLQNSTGIGQAVEAYLVTSDGTITDANISSGNLALSAANKRYNLQHVGSMMVDSSTSGDALQANGLVQIYARFFGVCFFNNCQQPLTINANDHAIAMTPMPDEIQ